LRSSFNPCGTDAGSQTACTGSDSATYLLTLVSSRKALNSYVVAEFATTFQVHGADVQRLST
jgi:hypothetical protein